MDLAIYCADVGSTPRGNFGWARANAVDSHVIGGDDIGVLVTSIVDDLQVPQRVALGFECPLYVPVPDEPDRLTRARPGEGNRSWSAGAGAGSLAVGLSQTVWILREIAAQMGTPPPVYPTWPEIHQAQSGLFLWEAFVTQGAKSHTHQGDAERGALAFRETLPDPTTANAINGEGEVRSLIGAAVLQAGLSTDLGWLSQPCLVLRVSE